MQSLPPGIRPRMRDKVAIVGFAKPHRDAAPFDDPEWEIWGVNDAWSFIPKGRATRWFDMHSPEIYEWSFRRSKGHVDWLRQFDGQVYLHESRADIPSSVAYPIEAVIARIGPAYLTNSIAYMLGLAYLLDFQTVGVWGVDMQHDSEYADQRPCCEFWLGALLAKRVRVQLPEASPLLKGPLYGRGYLSERGESISHGQLERRYKLLCSRQEVLAGKCDEIMAAREQLAGAIDLIRKLFGVMPERANELKARLDEYERHAEEGKAAWQLHKAELDKVRGMVEEAKYWIGITPEGQPPEQYVQAAAGPNGEHWRAPDVAPAQQSTRGAALV